MQTLVSVSDLETVDDHGITALFVAAQYGRHDDLQTLALAGNAQIRRRPL